MFVYIVQFDKLSEFYEYHNFCGTPCGILPINTDEYSSNVKSYWHSSNAWTEMMEKFEGDNVTETKNAGIGDLNHIYTFCLLWNGIYTMMYKSDASYECGLKTAIDVEEVKFR